MATNGDFCKLGTLMALYFERATMTLGEKMNRISTNIVPCAFILGAGIAETQNEER